ncbi:MAG: aldo/keto reductase [Candidatus Contendobacter sp.]|nr:aldo/keto reductase [Candidatus Contendobacter sp.]MDG4558529.1 aldo/keto reductase [Candidatus Contendobacter sp.]
MNQVVIEHTDIQVSRIAFGTGSLHHLFGKRQRQRLLETAASVGITHFDTAPYYGFGLAETDLGAFLHGRRTAFTITSKVGLYPPGGASRSSFAVWSRKTLGKVYPAMVEPRIDWRVGRAATSLNASLRRLKTDYIDFLLLHEPDIGRVNSDEFLNWLEREKRHGKIRCWGLAGLPELLERWLAVNHPLTQVLQTRDSLDRHEADVILRHGRQLQWTYGYLSSRRDATQTESASTLIRQALVRNPQGSILISTRRPERLNRLVELSE